jgi:hypothetical protein
MVREGVDWINLAQEKSGSCEHGNEPSGYTELEEFIKWATTSFSRKTAL